MIEAIIDWLMDSLRGSRSRSKGFKMKIDPIDTNYKYIPIINKKLLIQNQRRY